MLKTQIFKIFLVFLILILTETCVENVNLGRLIELWVRDLRRQNQRTDESFFKQRPIQREYDFVVVSDSNRKETNKTDAYS